MTIQRARSAAMLLQQELLDGGVDDVELQLEVIDSSDVKLKSVALKLTHQGESGFIYIDEAGTLLFGVAIPQSVVMPLAPTAWDFSWVPDQIIKNLSAMVARERAKKRMLKQVYKKVA